MNTAAASLPASSSYGSVEVFSHSAATQLRACDNPRPAFLENLASIWNIGRLPASYRRARFVRDLDPHVRW
jgi:hypothetical protein